MPTKLASAYIELHPWLSNSFSRDISGALGGISTDQAGEKIGGNLGTGVSKGLSANLATAGAFLTRGVTVPALAAGGAVAGIFASAGWKRLVSIDTARSKLKGLGYTASDVEGIMNSALASVKGTAFGLDEAANVAAMALASGVAPGEQLTGVLTTIGDTATVAGASFTDVGNIFASVMARGKLKGDDMLQLTSRGVPVLQALSRQLGVTTEDVSEMVSSGQVDFATFEAAMRGSFEGSAKASGESIQGTFANVQAAIGRVGAAFLDAGGDGEGFFSQVKPLLDDLIAGLDGSQEIAAEWGAAFGAAFKNLVEAGKGVLDFFNSLSPEAKQAAASIALVAVSAGPAIKLFGKVSGAASMVGKGFTAAVGVIRKFQGGMENMAIAAELGKGNLTGVGAAIGGLVNKSGSGAAGIVSKMGMAIASLNPVGVALGIAGVVAGIVALGVAVANASMHTVDYTKKVEEASAANTAMADAYRDNAQTVTDTSMILSASGQTVTQLGDVISNAENGITGILAQALSEQRGLRQSELDDIRSFNQQIADAMAEQTQARIDALETRGQLLADNADRMSAEERAAEIARIHADSQAASDAEQEAYQSRLASLAEQKRAGYMTEQEYNQLTEQAYQDHIDNMRAISGAESGVYGEQVTAIKGAEAQTIASFAAMMQQARDTDTVFTDAMGNIQTAEDGFGDRQRVTAEEFANAWSSVDQSAKDAFSNILQAALSSGGELDDATAQMVSYILGNFANLPAETDKLAGTALTGLLESLGVDNPVVQEIIDASEGSAQAIVDGLSSELNLEPMAQDEMAGFNTSLMGGYRTAVEQSAGAGTDIVNALGNAVGQVAQAATDMGNGAASGLASTRGAISGAAAGNADAAYSGMMSKSGLFFSGGASQGAGYGNGLGSQVGFVGGKAALIAEATTKVNMYAGSYYGWGSEVASQFAAGAMAKLYMVQNAVSSIASSIASKLHHTVPDEGPLRDDDEWGGHFVQNIASGIEGSRGLLEAASLDAARAIGFNPAVPLIGAAGAAPAAQGTTTYNVYIDGAQVNSTPEIEDAVYRLIMDTARIARMEGTR